MQKMFCRCFAKEFYKSKNKYKKENTAPRCFEPKINFVGHLASCHVNSWSVKNCGFVTMYCNYSQ